MVVSSLAAIPSHQLVVSSLAAIPHQLSMTLTGSSLKPFSDSAHKESQLLKAVCVLSQLANTMWNHRSRQLSQATCKYMYIANLIASAKVLFS